VVDTHENEDEDGVGPGPEPGKPGTAAPIATPPKRKRSGGKKRGDAELEPSLARLVKDVGRTKLAPDTTAVDRHYARSLTIRRLVADFLTENVGSTWRDPNELFARAANHAGCATNTAQRWVYQLTRVDAPFRLIEAIDYWLLERRDDHTRL